MEELYQKLRYISDRQYSIDLLKMQKEDFIKKWEGKDRVPFELLDQNEGKPPIIIYLSKSMAMEELDEKIRYNESDLEKEKLEAVKIMQRLIEEWT